MKLFSHSRRLSRAFSTRPEQSKKAPVSANLIDDNSTNPPAASKRTAKLSTQTHATRIVRFLKSNPQYQSIRARIPQKYLRLKRGKSLESLYLIDGGIAKRVVSQYILPSLQTNCNQIVAETNAGFGLIAEELLRNDIEWVRLYEPCSELRCNLKELHEKYPGRVELFTKDIFLLPRYDYIDQQDHGNRVEQLLRGLPKKKWEDDPVMTIIGSLSNTMFLRFLIRQIVLQSQIMSSGRFQCFMFMRPKDYVIMTAGPHLDLHTYQTWSVLSNLFLDVELLEKLPRNVFLPWETTPHKRCHYAATIDRDSLYFVKINFKKQLPVDNDNLLALYLFIKTFFRRGSVRIVPIVEKIIPGCGLNVLLPKLVHPDYFKDMSIFTSFGELTPSQIVNVFKEVIHHPDYSDSSIYAITDSHLVKTETIETDLEESLLNERHIVDNFEVKLDQD